MIKKCCKCNNEKLQEEFVKFKKNNIEKYKTICKKCENLRLVEYRKSEKGKEFYKNYNIKNKEQLQLYKTEYEKLNREKRNEEKRKLYHADLDKSKLNNKKKNKLNRQTTNIWYKMKRKTDTFFKLKTNIRGSIRNSFYKKKHNKKSKTIEILGCTFEEFKLHLESKFESWMNWDNMGNPKDGKLELNKTWDLDHIIPISTAICENDLIRLNHYSNYQPLCSYINRIIKKDKLI